MTEFYGFTVPDDNLSKCQWIFSKLGVCIDILKVWFWITIGQILSIFDSFLVSARNISVFSSPDDNLSKYQWIFTKLGMCIDIVEICFRITNGQILFIFGSVICPQYMNILISGHKLK